MTKRTGDGIILYFFNSKEYELIHFHSPYRGKITVSS